MGWWDDVKFVVTGAQTSAAKAAGQAIGQGATGAALGQAGFGGATGSAAGTVANAVSSGSGSAGTISMSREDMEDTLKRAQNLLNDITNQLGPAEPLTRIQAPAKDPASVTATESANNGGRYYVGHLRRQQAYLNKVIDKMQEALNITVQADENSTGTINDVGRGIAG
jgi:hypothetical protein